MIEINLVPDIKQEFLKTQRQRNRVISYSILAGIIAVGVVIITALWYASMLGLGTLYSNQIDNNSKELLGAQDLNKTVTLQSQLATIDALHSAKQDYSIIADLLEKVNPARPNNIKIVQTKVDPATRKMTITGTAENGYQALAVLKKTIEDTKVQYTDNNEVKSVQLTKKVYDAQQTTFGEDSSGKRVLQFTVGFEYAEELTKSGANVTVIPSETKREVTDSKLGVPTSLFGGGIKSDDKTNAAKRDTKPAAATNGGSNGQ